jgi:Tol biopolymer transport system component
VYRWTTGGWLKLNASFITGAMFVDSGRVNGTYRYRITATDTVGNESQPSNEALSSVFVAPPAIPAALTVSSAPGGNLLNLSWSASDGAAGYNIYRGQMPGGPYAKLNTTIHTETAYHDTPLINGTMYFYVVSALDIIGNESAYSSEAVGSPADTLGPEQPKIFFPTIAALPVVLYDGHTDIFGNADPASSVEVFVNGAFAGTARPREHDETFKVTLNNYYSNGSALSSDGGRVAFSDANTYISIVDLATGAVTATGQKGTYPKFSPDGRKILYASSSRLFIYDSEKVTSTPLTGTTYYEYNGEWSPDGQQVAFYTNRSGSYEVWIANTATGNLRQATATGYASNPKWSPDAKHIAYRVSSGKLFTLDLEDNVSTLVDSDVHESWYGWSPSGDKMLYWKNSAIWVADLAGQTKTILTPVGASEFRPVWSPDGEHILFTYYDGVLRKYGLATRNITNRSTRVITPGGTNGAAREHYWSKSGRLAHTERNAVNIVDIQGQFRFEAAHLTPGENLIAAVARDSNGNASPGSESVTVVYDAGPQPDVATTADNMFLYPPYPVAGEEMAINVAIGNPSAAEAKDVDVSIYLWNADNQLEWLKSERIPSIAPGSSELTSAVWDSTGKVGENRVVVVIDAEDNIPEVDETNNMAFRDFVVTESEGIALTTILGSAHYGNDRNVDINITAWNNGAKKDTILEVQIEDENGYPVSVFDPEGMTLDYGTKQTSDIVWNTGSTFAGEYTVHAVMRDASGVLAENIASFTITPDIVIESTIVTDKAGYGPRENVNAGFTVTNNGANNIISALRATVRIADAAGTVLFAETKNMINILPGSKVSLSSIWNTEVSLPGDYTVSLELSPDGQTVETKSVSFKVNAVGIITGSVTTAPSAVATGSAVRTTYTITNSGNVEVAGLTPKITVIDPETGEQKAEHRGRTIDVKQGQTITDGLTFSTQGLGLQTYTILLQYSDAAGTGTLASASFAVKDLAAPLIAVLSPISAATYNSAVPVAALVSDDASGIAQVEYRIDDGAWKLLPVADLPSGRYATTWEPSIASNGHHTVNLRATDKAGNTNAPILVSFEIQTDSEPPSTTVLVGERRYEGTGAAVVSGSTVFTFNATDNFSGVAKTEYWTDGGTFTTYTGPFTLTSLADGSHSIFYRSVDTAGNSEPEKSLTIVLDKTPPATTISASDPLRDGVVNTLSPKTVFTLTATDSLSGVKGISYSIDGGEWQSYFQGFTLAGLAAGQHAIAYKAVDNVLNEEMAKTVTVRLVVIEVEKSIAVDPAVLVGVWSDNSDQEQKTADIKAIEALLSSLGMTCFIAPDSDAFTTALRSGRYNVYILLDVKEPLVGEEVRETVRYGEGLVYMKTRHDADPFLDDVFGVKFTGKTTDSGLSVHLIESPISSEGTIQVSGKNVVASVTSDTAQAFGTVTDKNDAYPAVVSNQYGRGRSVLFTFDLLASPDQAQAAALLAGSINHVRPREHFSHALDSAPVRIVLRNAAEQVDVRVIEALPAGATAEAITPEAAYQDDVITYQGTLGANERASLGYYLNLPDLAGDYVTDTELRYLNGGEYRPYGNYGLTLTAGSNAKDLLQSIIADLSAMTPANADDGMKIADAVDILYRIEPVVSSANQAERNIRAIIDATNRVRGLSVNCEEHRLKLDELLKIWERKWYFFRLEE